MFRVLVLLLVQLAALRGMQNNPPSGGCSRQASGRNYKILLSISDSFFPVFMNFFGFYMKLCGQEHLKNLFLMCMDIPTSSKLQSLGLTCDVVLGHGIINSPLIRFVESGEWRGAQSRVWQYRTDITRQLLTSGYDVLVSDLDAYWLRNPFTFIDPLLSQGNDIIGSRGSFPPSVFEIFNASLCLGFVYYRASNNTRQLMSAVYDEIITTVKPDDQIMINELIFLKGNFQPIHNPNQSAMTNLLKRNDYLKGSFKLTQETANFTMFLALLPQNIVTRSCNTKTVTNSYIAHCYSWEKFKNADSKTMVAKRNGLWNIKKDWKKAWNPDEKILCSGRSCETRNKGEHLLAGNIFSP